MKTILLITSTIILSLSAVSCKKDKKEDETPKEAPVFTMTSPTENQVYQFGDTVKIKGTISAAYDMHGYNVKLLNVASNMNVLNQGYHEHGSTFVVNEAWKNTVTDTTQMKITIDAAIDHDGNLATKELMITCYPQ